MNLERDDLERVFRWLTRNGMGRQFPGMPIGWYQVHQCHAIDVLKEKFGPDADLYVRKGIVRSKGQKNLIISTKQVFAEADRRSRA